ncbi:MAG: DUF6327 family protein [Maribacter sp.]
MIMVKKYKSFQEIDARLEILKLQRQIDQESLKLHFNKAKIDLVPRNLLKGIGTSFTHSTTWKNMLITFVVKKVLGVLRKIRTKEIEE